MKKFFMFLAVIGVMAATASYAFAQDEEQAAPAATEQVASADLTTEEVPLQQALKTKFIEGGAGFMSLVIICLIIGLALSIERIIYLALSGTSQSKMNKLIESVKSGNVEAAKELCKNTRGPVATCLYEGLSHHGEGLEVVEKHIISQGSIETSKMENGLTWIALFIALAPSLGFLGTVIGMIQAFDDIQKAGDISPNVVAGGMKVALITTVGGLIVAMILQVFYNYILAKIEGISRDMEEVSLDVIDALAQQK